MSDYGGLLGVSLDLGTRITLLDMERAVAKATDEATKAGVSLTDVTLVLGPGVERYGATAYRPLWWFAHVEDEL